MSSTGTELLETRIEILEPVVEQELSYWKPGLRFWNQFSSTGTELLETRIEILEPVVVTGTELLETRIEILEPVVEQELS